jgi:hypothetical protein
VRIVDLVTAQLDPPIVTICHDTLDISGRRICDSFQVGEEDKITYMR